MNIASTIFHVLDPIPFGFFVAALIFDILYFNTFTILWVKAAAWLLSIGLLFAIVPQLINLARTWFGKGRTSAHTINFWLQVIAIVAAIFNAFVHSRDAYGTMPTGLWLSVVTVLALVAGRFVTAGHTVIHREYRHGQA